MKRNKLIIVAVLLLMPLISGAQVLKGSYFMDNSFNRHKMNPAFAPRSNYFQFPMIGGIGVGLMSNLDIPTFLYPSDNGLLTFLHRDVSVKEFERALPAHPHLDADMSMNLASFGFYTKRLSFWSFDAGLRTVMDVDLPADLFLFMKKGTGMSTNSYNIGNINAYASVNAFAAIGYSRDLSDLVKGLRAGIKFRLVAPMVYGGINLENVRLTTSPEKWTINTEGYADIALAGLDAAVPEPAEGEQVAMPEFKFNIENMLANKVLAGFGYSFDIGVEYKLSIGSIFDGISFSAAVTDLGRIRYKDSAVSGFNTQGKLEWEGMSDISMDSDFDSVLDKLGEDAKGLLNLSETDRKGRFSRSTMPNVYLGVDVPFCWRKMSVGLLYSNRKSFSYFRHELTASYNLKPCKWFALGVNYSFLNTFKTLGWLLELTPKVGPSFYLGSDYTFAEFAPAAGIIIPTALRMNLNFGLTMSLGSKYANPKKDKKKK